MKIYIIRHGETDANKNGILQGSSDWPLNEDGIKLAKISGENMKDIKFDICYSSPLSRAKKTAELILEYSGNKNTEIIYDKRLQELDMGTLEEKKLDLSELGLYRAIKMLMFRKNPFLVGRFPKGESAIKCCKRTQQILKEIATKNYETVLISTHGCALRAMLNMLYENKFNFWQGMVPYNCVVNIVEVKDGKMKLLEKDKTFYDDKYKIDRYKKIK